MRKIDRIVIHYTATADSWYADKSLAEKRAEIDRWHKARGWAGFGYHILIDKDGSYITGRPLEQAGAHAKGFNARSIGIAFIGNGKPTGAQSTTLQHLVMDLSARFRVPNENITGHRDLPCHATGCPGFDVIEWWATIRRHAGTAI